MTVTQSRPGRLAGLTLALLAFANLITSLDFTIIYVALPHIGQDAGFTAHGLQWVVSAYAVFYGGFLLLGGRLADLLGRRRTLNAGLILFGAASVLGGLASSPAPLIVARVLQGIGAALVFPATLSLVNTVFAEGRQRNRALMWWALAGAGGLSLGALLGGLLTHAFGWQAVFWVNLPLVGAALIGAFTLLDADRPQARGAFDIPGAITGTAGATLLVFAIAQAGEAGLTTTVAVAGVLAVLSLAGFVAIEARSRSPLMPLRLLANRNLSAGILVIVPFGAAMNTVMFFLTLYFQDVLAYTALQAGLAFLVMSLVIAAGDFCSERLMHRFGTRTTLIVGLLAGVAGNVLLAASMGAQAGFVALLPGVVVYGLGMGIVFPAMFAATGTGVADHEQGTASGMASTAFQVGIATGLAVLVAVSAAWGMPAAVYAAAAGTALGLFAAVALPSRTP
ncbi:MFS transporter [Nonomuraea sp. NPDC003214]